jgi:hypothetical protein
LSTIPTRARERDCIPALESGGATQSGGGAVRTGKPGSPGQNSSAGRLRELSPNTTVSNGDTRIRFDGAAALAVESKSEPPYGPLMIYATFREMHKLLGQLDKWLDAAAAYAEKKSFDPNVFIGLRLAPDQFAFARQVQAVCDVAKLAAARLAGKQPPSHPDTEQTLDELHTRVRAVIAYLDTFTEKDFEGAATRVVTQPRWEGKVMNGADYFLEHGLPNFFFHLTHVYAILRANGVDIGKRDYLGALSLRAP